ncbi:MAG: hypothetical protein ABI640_00300 [Gammaproteobacteria bacterium]
MRKPKEQVEEDSTEANFFDDSESSNDSDDSVDRSGNRDARRQKKPEKPARQRVELRTEQQNLRRQLSDWDDYGQDDSDVKL